MQFAVLHILIVTTTAIQLPPYFPKCEKKDPTINDCIVNAANDLRPFVLNGIKEIKLPSLNPYTLPNSYINHTSINARFEGSLRNLSFFGFDKYKFSDIEFFPSDVMLRGKVDFEQLRSNGWYSFTGRVGHASISGRGIIRQILNGVTFNFIIIGDLMSKNAIDYLHVSIVNIQLSIEQIVMHFSGLRRKSGLYGRRNTNRLFRKQSKVVTQTFTPVYAEIFEKYVTEYIEWFFKEIPFSNLFLNS